MRSAARCGAGGPWGRAVRRMEPWHNGGGADEKLRRQEAEAGNLRRWSCGGTGAGSAAAGPEPCEAGGAASVLRRDSVRKNRPRE